MNTKEAVEILRKQKVDLYISMTKDRVENNKTMDSIISLLQQGEKYKQTWEELKKERINEFESKRNNIVALSGLTEMEILEQKYFPKVDEQKVVMERLYKKNRELVEEHKEASHDYPEGEE